MTYQWLTTEVETPIVELSRQRARPGRRDELIALFEERLIEPQEAVGARVLGSFRLAEDPDAFVWLRGFTHMQTRRTALGAFHEGPAWQKHGHSASELTAARDDVHLMRAVAPKMGLPPTARLPRPAEQLPATRYSLLLSELRYPEWIGSYHLWLRLFLRKANATPLATFATLPADNNYAALPVRNRDVHVALLPSTTPLPTLPPELSNMLRHPPEQLVLLPTARSRLR